MFQGSAGCKALAYAVDSQAPNRGNGKWQAFDITFRSARYGAVGYKQENAIPGRRSGIEPRADGAKSW